MPLCTSDGHRSPLCTMVHNTDWLCTMQIDGAQRSPVLMHSVALTNPDSHTDRLTDRTYSITSTTDAGDRINEPLYWATPPHHANPRLRMIKG